MYAGVMDGSTPALGMEKEKVKYPIGTVRYYFLSAEEKS
jgi:hypothetical protein